MSVEGNLSALKIAEAVYYERAQLCFDSVRGTRAEDTDDLRTRASEEVQRVEAEVAVHEEVLQRFASEAAAQASHDQAELLSGLARANSVSDQRHKADLQRERDAHRHEMEKPRSDTTHAVHRRLELAHQAREAELARGKGWLPKSGWMTYLPTATSCTYNCSARFMRLTYCVRGSLLPTS